MTDPKDKPTKGPLLPSEPGAMAGYEAIEIADRGAERLRAPVIDRCVVIYLGPERNHSVAMTGRIVIEEYETDEMDARGEPVREIISKMTHEDGTQAYDFSTHNSRNGLIKARLWPHGSPELRGKPWVKVEHAEHIRRFMMAKQGRASLYRVMAQGEHKVQLMAYVNERNRRLRAESVATEETVGSSAAA